MRTITLSGLRAFILAQPNTRPVRLYEGDPLNSTTGCVLVHYCKEKKIKFTNSEFASARLDTGGKRKIVLEVVSDDKQPSFGVLDLMRAGMTVAEDMAIKNYGQLKKVLRD